MGTLAILLFLFGQQLSPQQQAEVPEYYSHFNRALDLIAQQKDEEAMAEFRKTLELKPGLYEAEINLGALLLRNNRVAEALPVLKDAAAAKPYEARPNLYYAQALFDSGDLNGAEPWFRAALQADPQLAQAQLGLARIQAKNLNLDEAAVHFRAANALLELASEYEKAGEPANAAAIYKQFPDNPGAQKRLAELERLATLKQADAFKDNHQLDKAAEQLRAALALDPGNFELRMDLARTLRDQHQYGPAAQEFLAAAKITPGSVAVWNELAAIFVINKNFTEALTALDRAKTLGAETPGQLYYRAISLDNLKQHPQAIDAYRRFLAASTGKLPDEEFLARQRIRIIENEMKRGR